jgi:hypothetical protein
VHVLEIVEMDDEELHVPDDVLAEASAAKFQILPKNNKITLPTRKNWKNLRVNENQWVKDSEWKTMSESEVNER